MVMSTEPPWSSHLHFNTNKCNTLQNGVTDNFRKNVPKHHKDHQKNTIERTKGFCKELSLKMNFVKSSLGDSTFLFCPRPPPIHEKAVHPQKKELQRMPTQQCHVCVRHQNSDQLLYLTRRFDDFFRPHHHARRIGQWVPSITYNIISFLNLCLNFSHVK